MLLRPGNAGSNTAADHVTIVQDALAHLLPDPVYRVGKKVLVRIDGAGGTHAARAEVAAPYAERGYAILTESPSILEHITLDDLRTTTGEPVTAEHTTTTHCGECGSAWPKAISTRRPARKSTARLWTGRPRTTTPSPRRARA